MARCARQYIDECMPARMHDTNINTRAARALANAIELIN